jgi:uncharacterized UBP type Zn finger protein
MPKIERQLSEVQFRSLLNAQLQLNQVQDALTDAQNRLNEVMVLIFDMHNLPLTAQFELDVENRKVIIEVSDPDDRPIIPIEDLAPDE